VTKLNGHSPPSVIDLKARVIVKEDLDKKDVQALLFPKWRMEQ